ncbi:hypothetical protein ACG02S_25675 [Roseateles sp. DC23W]|uniref:Uncharacterized protein n=1 Tax=Pelomonas dachongensis TaxID=3299029 RepID=A0ABW7EXE1_9BURK
MTWLLSLVAVPFFISLAVTVLNWEELAWWERMAYPLSGPVAAAALLFVGFAAINPADAALLLSTAVRAGWCLLRPRSGSRPS